MEEEVDGVGVDAVGAGGLQLGLAVAGKEADRSRDMGAGAELRVSSAELPPVATSTAIVAACGVQETPGTVIFQANVGDR